VAVCLWLTLPGGARAQTPPAAEAAATADLPLLLGPDYPIEVSVSFHQALLHWMDSLTQLTGAGGTAGKTVAAYRRSFERHFGNPSDEDGKLLLRYRDARLSHVRKTGPEGRDGVTLAFFETATLDQALERSRGLLDGGAAEDLAAALRHFELRYRRLWAAGRTLEDFCARAVASKRRDDLAGFLVRVADFYGVAPDEKPRPRLVLAPVPSGSGTHAQAIDHYLLIEIRRDESLADEAAPIAHENAHLLFKRIPQARRDALRAVALAAGPRGEEAWRLLHEALPTAIAQGLADRSFRAKVWSTRIPWYHVEAVDRYAKRIFPLVDAALANGGRLDEALVERLIAAHR